LNDNRNGGAIDLRDALVVVGATAHSLGDWHATPYSNGSSRLPWTQPSELMAGPEVQANVVATMADGAYITTPPWLTSLPWTLALCAALGAGFARLNLTRGAILAVLHHFCWKGLALGAFCMGNWRVEVLAMTLAGGLAYAASFALRWRVLRRMFGAVKGEAIARALEDEPGYLRGQERELTVLFSDVRDFTAYSDSRTPAEVVELLNAYFAAVVPQLEAEGATVDKYIGDGIMAFFNAPPDQPDHALRAARAAVGMVRRVREKAALWESRGFPGLRIGVGVHTGPAVVGPIGSPRRLDYTAIGDTVNAAARIEAQNKTFGSEVLLSAATYAALPEAERARLGCSTVPEAATLKGKTQAAALHRVEIEDVPSRSLAAADHPA
jgi:adenylate cyclase